MRVAMMEITVTVANNREQEKKGDPRSNANAKKETYR